MRTPLAKASAAPTSAPAIIPYPIGSDGDDDDDDASVVAFLLLATTSYDVVARL